MTNNNDNRIELIGLNEFTQVADAVQELAAMADRELRSDARKAHKEVTEAVAELLAIIEEQKAEIKLLRAERDQVRNEFDEWKRNEPY
jgi:ribosomal protein L18E